VRRAALQPLPKNGPIVGERPPANLNSEQTLDVWATCLQEWVSISTAIGLPMASIDLDNLSKEELTQLQKDVTRAIAKADIREKQKALAAAESAARDFGYSLDEVLTARAGKTKAKSPPKFRDPKNPANTWSGMGRKPDWLKAALDAGSSLDELRIAS
jgi:DNA-binding protein H-NS